MILLRFPRSPYIYLVNFLDVLFSLKGFITPSQLFVAVLLCLFQSVTRLLHFAFRISCRILGIPCGNLIMIDDSNRVVDSNLKWDSHRIGQTVLLHIRRLNFDTVITFDERQW